MWITKQLIELIKSSIAVESIKKVGTHIIVTLPEQISVIDLVVDKISV